MSSRFYPIYQKGNPQLRVFLPNFWMKLVSPEEKQPPNVVQFKVPTGMTDHDIRNYLEKIYKIKVMEIRSDIENGKLKEAYKNGPIVKEDDFRRAYVTLPRDQPFEYPEVCKDIQKLQKEQEEQETLKRLEESFDTFKSTSKERPGLPPWFNF